jgi:hypothetical protein
LIKRSRSAKRIYRQEDNNVKKRLGNGWKKCGVVLVKVRRGGERERGRRQRVERVGGVKG